jgi:hypothetical protein
VAGVAGMAEWTEGAGQGENCPDHSGKSLVKLYKGLLLDVERARTGDNHDWSSGRYRKRESFNCDRRSKFYQAFKKLVYPMGCQGPRN